MINALFLIHLEKIEVKLLIIYYCNLCFSYKKTFLIYFYRSFMTIIENIYYFL